MEEKIKQGQWQWQEEGTSWKGVGIYHLTLTIPSREPLLGKLVIPNNDPTQARIERTELGKALLECQRSVEVFHPEIQILKYSLMPDHLHSIWYVRRPMPQSIRYVAQGFWRAAKKIGRGYSYLNDGQGTRFHAGLTGGTINENTPSSTTNEKTTGDATSENTPSSTTNERTTSGATGENTPSSTTNENTTGDATSENTPSSTTNENTPSGTTSEKATSSTTNENTTSGTTSERAPGGTTNENTPSGTTSEKTTNGATGENTPSSTTNERTTSGTTSERAPGSTTNERTTSGATSERAGLALSSIAPGGSRENPLRGMLGGEAYSRLFPIFTEVPFIRPLSRRGQLRTMIEYVQMNPQRLATKHLMPGYFRVQKGIEIAGQTYAGVGNIALLQAAHYATVHVSHILVNKAAQGNSQPLRDYMNGCVIAARRGTVMVSPFISPREKDIKSVLLAEGHPFIVLEDNGFRDYYKPSGELFEAVAVGRVLILSPWEYDASKRHISRAECVALNGMAEQIAAM